MLIIMMGIQQQKSVITMKTRRFAMADSLLRFVDRTARETRFTVQNMDIYATRMKMKEMEFNTTKKATEYSQPAGRPADSCNGRQTAERL